MSAEHDPAVCELLSFFDTQHLPAHLAEAARPFCEAARALAAGDVGPMLDLVEPGGRERLGSRECCAADVKLLMARDMLRNGRAAISGLAPVLRLLLEAKDCAVRAVLVVQRSMGPEVVAQLAQVPPGCESLCGHPPDLDALRELGALEPAGVDEQPDQDGIVEARLTALGHVMVRIARSCADRAERP